MNSEAQSLPWNTAVDLVEPDEQEKLWRAGLLFWLLHGDQADAYRKYRAWAKDAHKTKEGNYRRLFVFDCGRRWGKDWLCLVIKIEDALRQPGSIHTYATAFAKDIGEIVIPLMREILETCPLDIEPHYKTAQKGETQGYYFPNGSVIKLVGIDKNPDGLRGRGSDGVVITEAAYVAKLEQAVKSVVYPQFQKRDNARLILQSTAPATPNHPYDTVFLRDAKKRGAWTFRTIEDNPMIDEDEREEFIAAAGGREDTTCRREYFGERVREDKDAIVPEFELLRHVVDHIPSPEWADTYVGGDPGMRDLFGIVWAFWDPERNKLCVQLSWAKRNAGTAEVARAWIEGEQRLWNPEQWKPSEKPDEPPYFNKEVLGHAARQTQWWDGGAIRSAPYARVSDTDTRLLSDLYTDHGIAVMEADKTGTAEASLYNLRTWFHNDWIEIDRVGGAFLIEQLQEGRWNPHRTDYLRTEEYGHLDLIDALRYLVRHVDRERVAIPPAYILDPTLQRAIVHTPGTKAAQAFNSTLSRRNRWNNR